MRATHRKDVKALTCEDCLAIKEKLDVEPDCVSCKNPYLWKVNRSAFQIYNLISSRLVYDFHLAQLVFETFRLQLTQDEAVMLLEKLVIIHREMSKTDEDLKAEEEEEKPLRV